MKGKLPAGLLSVFAASFIFCSGIYAQSTGTVSVSNTIEGGFGGVSTARCGNSIVTGFGDTEHTPQLSFNGISRSKDGGKSFLDLGTLKDSDPAGDGLGGDNPVVLCSSANKFYYASIEVANPTIFPFTQISFAASTDGGTHWGAPVPASSGTNDVYHFASPSMAVDPTNPMHLYVAYLNFNNAPVDFPDCNGSTQVILEFVTSSDGGKSWSGRPNPAEHGLPSMQLDHACLETGADPARNGTLSGPNVIVSPGGKVYLVYEFVGSSFAQPNEIRFMRSLDHGKTFSKALTVSRDAVINAAPQLAVDRTASRTRGTVYLTWSGSPTGTYTDILVSDSTDLGVSFSFPRPITAAPGPGVGRYQSNPVVAVDGDGEVAICFYQTPSNKPSSTAVYSYDCATSFNRAATWQAQRIADSAPVGFNSIASDSLLGRDGFFTAFEIQASGKTYVVGKAF
jgi:hypothetical protein